MAKKSSGDIIVFYKKKGILITLMFFILFIYFLIPTESLSDGLNKSLLVRFIGAAILVIVLFIKNRFIKSKKLILCFLIFSIIYLIQAFSSISFKLLISFESLLLGVLWTSSLYSQPFISTKLIAAVKILIYTSAFSLFLQFIVFHSFSYLLDMHSLVFPWSEARYELHDGFIRMGGMYIEPGTFSNWIYAFLLLYLLSETKIDNKLILITAISMMFTMSVWGFSIAVLVFAFYILQREIIKLKGSQIFFKLRKFVISTIFFVLIIILINFFVNDAIYDFILTKLRFETGSGEVRLKAYDEFFKILPNILLFGMGYGSNFCKDCQSPQDAGLIISFSVVYGLVFSLIFFIIIFIAYYKVYGLKGVILAIPLLSSKLFYWDYVVILIFFSAFYRIFLFKRN